MSLTPLPKILYKLFLVYQPKPQKLNTHYQVKFEGGKTRGLKRVYYSLGSNTVHVLQLIWDRERLDAPRTSNIAKAWCTQTQETYVILNGDFSSTNRRRICNLKTVHAEEKIEMRVNSKKEKFSVSIHYCFLSSKKFTKKC